MATTLQKLALEKPKSMNDKETYLLRNYYAHIEHQKAVLYHLGKRITKETQPRRTVVQEELFGLLDKVHIGHGG